jgi:hypothetical protein
MSNFDGFCEKQKSPTEHRAFVGKTISCLGGKTGKDIIFYQGKRI